MANVFVSEPHHPSLVQTIHALSVRQFAITWIKMQFIVILSAGNFSGFRHKIHTFYPKEMDLKVLLATRRPFWHSLNVLLCRWFKNHQNLHIILKIIFVATYELNTGNRHDANVVVTGGTGGCHIDNLRDCHIDNLRCRQCPTDARRNINAIIMSKRRCNVVSTQ